MEKYFRINNRAGRVLGSGTYLILKTVGCAVSLVDGLIRAAGGPSPCHGLRTPGWPPRVLRQVRSSRLHPGSAARAKSSSVDVVRKGT